MAERQFSFGADPEFFVYDTKEGRIVPSCGKFGGEKGKPLNFSYGGCLEDNVTLELNPKHAQTFGGARDNTQRLKKEVEAYFKQYELRTVSEVLFDNEDLKHKKAQEFGCDPDRDAYTGTLRPRVDPKEVGGWRFAGGHIHIGIKPWPNVPKHIFVKLFELFAYAPFCHLDTQGNRKKYYGLGGLWRDKEYGVEYRTPSNFWMQSTGSSTLAHYLNLFSQKVTTVTETLALENNRANLVNIYNLVDWDAVRAAIAAGKDADPPQQVLDIWHDCTGNYQASTRQPVVGGIGRQPLRLFVDDIDQPEPYRVYQADDDHDDDDDGDGDEP